MRFVTLNDDNLGRVANAIGTTEFQVYMAFADKMSEGPFMIDIDTWRERWRTKRVFSDHDEVERFELTEMIKNSGISLHGKLVPQS